MTTAKGLEVGAAAQCTLDFDQDRPGTRTRWRELAQLEPARLDQHRLARMRTARVRLMPMRVMRMPANNFRRLWRSGQAGSRHSLRSTANAASIRSGSARWSKSISAAWA